MEPCHGCLSTCTAMAVWPAIAGSKPTLSRQNSYYSCRLMSSLADHSNEIFQER